MDITEYQDRALKIKEKFDQELAEVQGKARDLRPDALERARKEARARYDQAIADLQEQAQQAIVDRRQALAAKHKRARQESWQKLRQTVGDTLAANLLYERLEGLDGEGLARAYQDAADDFARTLIAHRGARLLADQPHLRERFRKLVSKDDPTAALEAELEELDRLERYEVAQLDQVGHTEGIRARYGIGQGAQEF